jgi:hypothetical protein
VPEGVSVSADGLAASHVGTAYRWQGALVEPAFSSAERCYAEWVIEEADADCCIMIGVTDLDAAPPPWEDISDMPGSRMYYCFNSMVYPGGRDWGAMGGRARGDRVGLLVERGGVSVYVNGARLGPGPMATDLPQRVRTAHRLACLFPARAGAHTRADGANSDQHSSQSFFSSSHSLRALPSPPGLPLTPPRSAVRSQSCIEKATPPPPISAAENGNRPAESGKGGHPSDQDGLGSPQCLQRWTVSAAPAAAADGQWTHRQQ